METYLLLINSWISNAGGIQTFNRQFAKALSRVLSPQGHRVICLVPFATQEEVTDAYKANITLISGQNGDDLLSAMMATGLESIDSVVAVIGHSRFSGRHAAVMRHLRFPAATLVHFVHMNPLQTETLKTGKSEISKPRQDKVTEEINLTFPADLVACVGPRLTRYMRDNLSYRLGTDADTRVLEINCGFSANTRKRRLPTQPTILMTGRSDSIEVKGIDLFAKAAGLICKKWQEIPNLSQRPLPHFLFRGAGADADILERKLQQVANNIFEGTRIIVQPYSPDEETVTEDLYKSSVFLMPSREEGFGLAACEAMSLGVPTIISSESGLAELLRFHAQKEHMLVEPYVIDMQGTEDEISEKLAKAVIQVLSDEEHAAHHTHRLYQLLLEKCSWDSAAIYFIEQINVWRSLSQNQDGDQPDKEPEGVTVKFNLSDESKALLAVIPGFQGFSVKQEIVVYIDEDIEVDPVIPDSLEGVRVVSKKISKIVLSSKDNIIPGTTISINLGERSVTTGFIVKDNIGRTLAFTAAHAFDNPQKGYPIQFKVQDKLIPGNIVFLDYAQDIALVEFNYDCENINIESYAKPRIDMDIVILAPNFRIPGKISDISVFIAGLSESVNGENKNLFLIRTDIELERGLSGAAIIEPVRNSVVGIVLAVGSGLVVGMPVYDILKKNDLEIWRPSTKFLDKNLVGSVQLKEAMNVDVGVVCIDPQVFEIIVNELVDVVEYIAGTSTVIVGRMKSAPRTNLAVLRLDHVGNISTAIASYELLTYFNPKLILVITNGSGSDKRSVKSGDIVFADTIIYYERAIKSKRGLSPRFQVVYSQDYKTSNWLRKTLTDVPDNWSNSRIHFGRVASGEKIYTDVSMLSELTAEWKDILIADNETAGVALAVSQVNKHVPIVSLIRATGSIIDESKSRDSRSVLKKMLRSIVRGVPSLFRESGEQLPKVYIASSVESLDLAYAVQDNLELEVECKVWFSEKVRRHGKSTKKEFFNMISELDFAIIIIDQKDMEIFKGDVFTGTDEPSRRSDENIIYELGYLSGHLGTNRTFVILQNIPSDSFHLETKGSHAFLIRSEGKQEKSIALLNICNMIRNEIKKMGRRNSVSSEFKQEAIVESIFKPNVQDIPYEPEILDQKSAGIFEQINREFGNEYKIWVRYEDFRRNISAGIINPLDLSAVIVPVVRGSKVIRKNLTSQELDLIRLNLSSGKNSDYILLDP